MKFDTTMFIEVPTPLKSRPNLLPEITFREPEEFPPIELAAEPSAISIPSAFDRATPAAFKPIRFP